MRLSGQCRLSVRHFAKLPGGDPGVLLGVKVRVRALVHGTEPALVSPLPRTREGVGRKVCGGERSVSNSALSLDTI